jgi:hypothetical protein
MKQNQVSTLKKIKPNPGIEKWEHFDIYKEVKSLFDEKKLNKVNKQIEELETLYKEKENTHQTIGCLGQSQIGKSSFLSAVLLNFEGDIGTRKEKSPLVTGKNEKGGGTTEVPILYKYSKEKMKISVEYCSFNELQTRLQQIEKFTGLRQDILGAVSKLKNVQEKKDLNYRKKILKKESEDISNIQLLKNSLETIINDMTMEERIKCTKIIVKFPFPGLNESISILDVNNSFFLM